ncbi:K(+)-transporting ATPase subunit F [Edaphobacter sp. 12200R-103]
MVYLVCALLRPEKF